VDHAALVGVVQRVSELCAELGGRVGAERPASQGVAERAAAGSLQHDVGTAVGQLAVAEHGDDRRVVDALERLQLALEASDGVALGDPEDLHGDPSAIGDVHRVEDVCRRATAEHLCQPPPAVQQPIEGRDGVHGPPLPGISACRTPSPADRRPGTPSGSGGPWW
jgi:hypothetical protein